MIPICNHELSLISGDSANFDRIPNSQFAAAIQAVFKPRDPTPLNDEYGDAEPICTQYHQPVATKNGDRNSLGQQYSWGT